MTSNSSVWYCSASQGRRRLNVRHVRLATTILTWSTFEILRSCSLTHGGASDVSMYLLFRRRIVVRQYLFAMYVIGISVVPINIWPSHCSHGILVGLTYA